MTERRVLFSVIQVTAKAGGTWMEVEWNHDLYPVLEHINPDGELTDRIVDLAEEVVRGPDDDSDTSASSL